MLYVVLLKFLMIKAKLQVVVQLVSHCSFHLSLQLLCICITILCFSFQVHCPDQKTTLLLNWISLNFIFQSNYYMSLSHFQSNFFSGHEIIFTLSHFHQNSKHIKKYYTPFTKSNTLTHNYNCLKGTITFEVHPITPTSPKNTLSIIFRIILILFAFFFFAYFSFWTYHARVYKREKKYLIIGGL